MSAEIAEECGENTERDRILASLARIEALLARIEPLIPAAEQAVRFLDNPVKRYREAQRSRRDDRHAG